MKTYDIFVNVSIGQCIACTNLSLIRGKGCVNDLFGDLPLITYAPRGRGGVKPSIHFYCVLHAQRGGGQIACKIAYVIYRGPLVTCIYIYILRTVEYPVSTSSGEGKHLRPCVVSRRTAYSNLP